MKKRCQNVDQDTVDALAARKVLRELWHYNPDTRVSSEVELHELLLLLEKELELSDSEDCRSAASSNASSHSRRSSCLLESFGIVVAVEGNTGKKNY
ncbi:hypothetical protein PsorP6_011894 [Peronosclerospora sorghi]|uniref:Uncharacterized protein n=1 Tax=Peronosclerospora sorghi TaxID=230839 RepID=A0ACC0WIC7_9STRA|nr:hypothetical protein PsorP6_011894 [Peronosclerospora sorghi]